MKNISKIILVILATLIMLTTTASAASYYDGDGDGICEPGEEITFEGDISYIDSYGNEHLFDSWYWDFEGDGSFVKGERVVTHTFDTEGYHTVTLVQTNGDGFIIAFEIEVKSNDPEPLPNSEPEQVLAKAIDDLEGMKPTGDHKLDKTLDKAIKELNKAINEFEKDKLDKAFDKIAKAIKHLEKAQKKGAATQGIIDDLVDLVRVITEDAIQDAIDMGESVKDIQKANKDYNKALDKLNDGKYDKAVKEFKKAYKDAMKALN